MFSINNKTILVFGDGIPIEDIDNIDKNKIDGLTYNPTLFKTLELKIILNMQKILFQKYLIYLYLLKLFLMTIKILLNNQENYPNSVKMFQLKYLLLLQMAN